jgi:thiol-disulfide isomerase/thioredoxin
MRIFFIILMILSAGCCFAQKAQKESLDTLTSFGQKVPDIDLYDVEGNKVKISSFKGKVLYLDFWSTTCAPCMKLFPFEEELISNLVKLGLDTSILIIKICSGSPIEQWKSIINEHKSSAINLILPGKDFKIWRRFKIPHLATYQIVGKDFRYLGKDVSRPNDTNILYCLFRAMENVSFKQSINEIMDYTERYNNNDPTVPVWYAEWRKKIEN